MPAFQLSVATQVRACTRRQSRRDGWSSAAVGYGTSKARHLTHNPQGTGGSHWPGMARAAVASILNAAPTVDTTRTAGPVLRWTWQQNDPTGREGEYFETPVVELEIAPEICGSR
jgi:hypothetical protein